MKKGIALLLAALVLLFTGTAAFAEGGSGLQKGDTVYLGRWQDAPIRWTVLDPDATNAGGNGLFLLCEQALTNQGVIYSWTKAVWQGSEGQTWCSALLEQSFSAAEQAAVPAVSKSEEGLQQYGLSWGPVELENEKVFFLSVRELGDYIGPNDGDPGLSATYVGNGKPTYYWLRTPHASHPDYAGLVLEGNEVHDYLVYGSWAGRPATNLGGEGLLSEIVIQSVGTGERTVLKADEEDGVFGLFGFTGKRTTGMFDGVLDMQGGYIVTNEKMETNIPGVYAAGDVRVTPLRQVVTACADGAVAAMQCGKYLRNKK